MECISSTSSDGQVAGYYIGSNGGYGFVYNGSAYTTISDPSAVSDLTVATGISGQNVIGYYLGSENQACGFLYNSTTQTFEDIEEPLGSQTGNVLLEGIDGNNVVGYITTGSNNISAFLYNIVSQSYSTINDPLGVEGTFPNGISGKDIVGFYDDANGIQHGFLYDGNTFTTIDMPSSPDTNLAATDGTKIIGDTKPNTGSNIAFEALITSVPEPGITSYTFATLAFIGAFTLANRHRGTQNRARPGRP